MYQPTIGIILINYKDYATRFLADCRDSFRKLEYPANHLKIYIVDNATSPESQAYLKETYPEATIIPNAENSGWGGGNNRGMAQAFKDGCEDIVFSNMDVIVDSQWLQELVNAAYSDSNIGIVQSKLFLHPPRPDGTYWINSLGNRFHPCLKTQYLHSHL
jgi:GT2 family glycosyltransferase